MPLLITLQDASRKTWSFDSGVVRIGRDPSCEVHLPEDAYSMVSRAHASIGIENGVVRFTDLGSANGLLHNGKPEKSGELRDNDVLQLGASGPSLAIGISAAANDKTVLAADATRVVTGSRTVLAAQAPTAAAPFPKVGIAPGNPETAAPAPPTSKAPPPVSFPTETIAAMEKKLKSLYLLTAALAAMVAVLLGFTFYLSSQIEKNRQQLLQIEAQADDQIQKLAPQLKTRLDSFDKQVSSVDEKMQSAEDNFVRRLNTELPALMDRYIARKTKELETKVNAIK